jgi:Methyltransferase domain
MTLPGSAFDAFGPYWEYFEQAGLSGEALKSIEPIVSPVLVLGSGQGVVSQTLTAAGHDVTNVDCSRAMIDYARTRRQVETILGDAASIALERRFATVIIATGILTDANVHTRFVTDVVNNADRHLSDDGHVVLAYFRRSRAREVLERLGLLGHPSTNAKVWEGRDSLAGMKAALMACGYGDRALDVAFVVFDEALDRQRQLMADVGHAYVRARGVAAPPPEFLDQFAELGECYLSSESEDAVRKAIEDRHTIVNRLEPADDTIVLVYKRT